MKHICLLISVLSLSGPPALHAQETAQPPVEEAAPVEPTPPQTEGPLAEPGAPAKATIVLDLESAQRQALADNPSLKMAEARVRQAQALVEQARSAWYPQVGAEYTATQTRLPDSTVDPARDAAFRAPINQFAGQFGGPASQFLFSSPADLIESATSTLGTALNARDAVPDTVDRYALNLNATWILFDGFGRKFRNAIARYAELETGAARLEVNRLLLEAVAQAYYGVQLAREIVAIAQADEEFNQRLLKDAQARRRVGTGSLSDELNFEVGLRAARSARLAAERDRQIARIGLAALMGIHDAGLPADVDVSPLGDEQPADMTVPDTDEAISLAMNQRPDIARADYGVARSGAAVSERKSVYYPRVAAIASANAERGDDSRFDRDDFGTTAGVSVSYDIFTGGRNRAQVAEAKAARDEAVHGRADIEINAAAEVREALARLENAQQTLILQRATTEYVERNRDLVEREYAAGQAALTRLNEAQRDLIAARARLASARVGLRQTWHSLRTATADTLTILGNPTATAAE
jgi:outer membrane protein TolC